MNQFVNTCLIFIIIELTILLVAWFHRQAENRQEDKSRKLAFKALVESYQKLIKQINERLTPTEKQFSKLEESILIGIEDKYQPLLLQTQNLQQFICDYHTENQKLIVESHNKLLGVIEPLEKKIEVVHAIFINDFQAILDKAKDDPEKMMEQIEEMSNDFMELTGLANGKR